MEVIFSSPASKECNIQCINARELLFVCEAVCAIDGALFSITSELPGSYLQNSTKNDHKGHNSEYLGEKMASGNSEVAFLSA